MGLRQLERQQDWRVVKIKEVNPTTSHIHADDQYGTRLLLDLTNKPAFFQMPVPGEIWSVRRRGSDWLLETKLDSPDVSTPVSSMNPGDARIETPGAIYITSLGTDGIILSGNSKITGNVNITGTLVSASDPWIIDIDPFMTATAHTNWDNLTQSSILIYGATKDSSGVQNDEINWDVVVPAGVWTFELMHFRDVDRGIYTVYFDTTVVGTIDGYGLVPVRNRRDSLAGLVFASTTAKRRLKLKMATKGGLSSGYLGSIQHVQLKRIADDLFGLAVYGRSSYGERTTI